MEFAKSTHNIMIQQACTYLEQSLSPIYYRVHLILHRERKGEMSFFARIFSVVGRYTC